MPEQTKKEFNFRLGADPEFNILLQGKKIDAKALIKKIMNDESKEQDCGYKIERAGELGWDGYHSTGELRPLPSKNPKKLVNNIGRLFKELTSKTKLFDISTLSDKGSVGGHLHFEMDDLTAKSKAKKATIHRIMSTFYIPLMLGENRLNLKIRMKGSFGNMDDYRVEQKGNAYTYELRIPSAEWMTTPKIAYATICYLAVVYHEALNNPRKVKKECSDIIYSNMQQGEALQKVTLSGIEAITKIYINKIKKYIKTFELYPLYKNEIDYILKPNAILKEKEKVNFNIVEGWDLIKIKTPTKKQLFNKKNIEKESLKIDMDGMMDLIKMDYNKDINVDLMVNEIKQRIIALGWKLKNTYYLFGMRKGIDAYIAKDKNGHFLIGQQICKTISDTWAIDELFKRIAGRVRLPSSIDKSNSIIIGLPYADRIKKNPKKLIELIYNIEKEILQPTNLSLKGLKNDEDLPPSERGKIWKQLNQEEQTGDLLEEADRTEEAEHTTRQAMREEEAENGEQPPTTCRGCGSIVVANNDGYCNNEDCQHQTFN